jgi:hypothetical protein
VLSLNEGNPNEYPRIFVHQGGWQYKEQASSIPTNTWIHLAATYDAANLRLYRDGTEVAAGPITGNMTDPSGSWASGGVQASTSGTSRG